MNNLTITTNFQVMFIRTPKGMYLRMGDKIIKIRLSPAMMATLKAATTAGASAAQGPPQVVTIDSSSDSEEPTNTNGAEKPVVNQFYQHHNQQFQNHFSQQQQRHAEGAGYSQFSQPDLNEDSIPVRLEDLQVNAEDFQVDDFQSEPMQIPGQSID
jgi:hypothetical protein